MHSTTLNTKHSTETCSIDRESLVEHVSGYTQESSSILIGTFTKNGRKGDYCRMPCSGNTYDVFVMREPLLWACVNDAETGKFVAETHYLQDGISQTVTYKDDLKMGRDYPKLLNPISLYAERIEKTRKKMKAMRFDALIATDLHDIVYLCGHHTEGGSFIALVITHDAPPFLVGRYLELGDARLLSGSNAFEGSYVSEWWCVEDHQDPVIGVQLALKHHGLKGKRIGFEHRGLSKGDEVEQYKKLKGIEDRDGILEIVENAPLAEFKLIDVPRFIEEFRMIKTPLQIEKIRIAGKYANLGIQAGIQATRPGVTDRDIIAHIVYAMMAAGSRMPAYGPFVSIGPTSARGHATGFFEYVNEGDLVCIEVGGSFERMHCASMQMCYVGHELPSWLQESETILTEIFEKVLPAMKPGVPACEIHAMVDEIYKKCNFWYTRYARSSYNIGGKAFPQDWSEGGFSCVKGSDEPLQEGLVQHFIPWASTPFGAYFKSVTVWVSKEGAVPLMNFSTKVHLIPPN